MRYYFLEPEIGDYAPMAEMSFNTNDKTIGALQNAVRKLEKSASKGENFFQNTSKIVHKVPVLSNVSEGLK